jgi:hypothetical protein
MAFCGEGGGWSRSKNSNWMCMREILKATFLNVTHFGTNFSPARKIRGFFSKYLAPFMNYTLCCTYNFFYFLEQMDNMLVFLILYTNIYIKYMGTKSSYFLYLHYTNTVHTVHKKLFMWTKCSYFFFSGLYISELGISSSTWSCRYKYFYTY